MSLELVEFRAEHVIDLTEVDEIQALKAVRAENNIRNGGGFGFSAMLDGKCIGCAWCIQEGDLYSLWMQTTDELVNKHRFWFHRQAVKQWRAIRAKIGDMPVRAICDSRIEKNVQWARRFGFEPTPYIVMEAAA